MAYIYGCIATSQLYKKGESLGQRFRRACVSWCSHLSRAYGTTESSFLAPLCPVSFKSLGWQKY